ncbi:MAG: heparin lyase I family protein, partial [Planctomycetota bacterium]
MAKKLFCFVAFVVALGLAGNGPAVCRGEVLFYDGFESGDSSAWTGANGDDSYVTTDPHSGNYCGKMTQTGGTDNVGMFWYKIDAGGSGGAPLQCYYMGWWKFPTDWRFGPDNGPDFKAWIGDATAPDERAFLNFRGSGTIGTLAFLTNKEGYWHYCNGAEMPCDGQWHSVELYTDRINGWVKVWLDGNLCLDEAVTLGTTKWREVKWGAYNNSTAYQTMSFYMDDITLSSTRIGGGPQPPGQASNPSPSNGATSVSVDADLSWSGGSGSTSSDVY